MRSMSSQVHGYECTLNACCQCGSGGISGAKSIVEVAYVQTNYKPKDLRQQPGHLGDISMGANDAF